MTMPARHSRKIKVDGQLYRWRMRRLRHQQSLVLLAESESGLGTVLVADLGRRWFDGWLVFPDPILSTDWVEPARPGEVAECIREARQGGWRPDERGKPFRWNRASAR